jgi:hypothetical protein
MAKNTEISLSFQRIGFSYMSPLTGKYLKVSMERLIHVML